MKTNVMGGARVLSMAGGSALFAQTAKEVIFRIKDIPANQGKILLTTEPGQYCSAVDATSSAVELKIEDMPNGEYPSMCFTMQIRTRCLTRMRTRFRWNVVPSAKSG